MPKDITKDILKILEESHSATALVVEVKKHIKKPLLVVEDNLGSLSVRGDADIEFPYVARVNALQHRLIQAITAAHEFVHLWQYGTGAVLSGTPAPDLVMAEVPAKALEATVYFELLDLERETYKTLAPQQQQLLDVSRDDAFAAAHKPDAFLLQQFKTYYPRHTKKACTLKDSLIINALKQSDYWASTDKWLKAAKSSCPID